MCGIAGIYRLDQGPVRNAESRAAKMIALLRHRGPNGEGLYISPERSVVLINTRLAVVDPENDFAVPMAGIEGDAVLTFNGEIFNFADLRRDFEQRGVRFQTKSDTEVLLEGLRREGADFLHRADGFWGFGYYERKSRQLLLSRDLLGERHIFYTVANGELIFASEINPILAVMDQVPDIDFSSVMEAFQFRAPGPGKTLLKGIHRIRPGFNLVVDPTGKIETKRHRKLHPEKWFDFFDGRPSEQQVIDVYEEEISRACASRIPLEVPYGASLSGGIDSAIVNYYAVRNSPVPVDSYFGTSTETPFNKGDELDERQASLFTAERTGSRHHDFSMIDDDVIGITREQCANSFDGLFCEGTVSFRQLAGAVKNENKRVLLLSDGPDELVGGYAKDQSALYWNQRFGNGLLGALSKSAGQSRTGRAALNRFGLGDLVNYSFLKDKPFAYRPIHGGTTPEIMNSLFPEQAISEAAWPYGVIDEDYSDLLDHLDLSQRMALSYASTSLPDYFNIRSDRATNWHSIECRLPLQAPRLAELAIATPMAYRFNGFSTSKFVMRKIVERRIGPEIAWRKKYGFAMPMWHIDRLSKMLKFEDAVRSSSAFDDLPFQRGARDIILAPDQGRTRWFAYCLIATHAKLKSADFAIDHVPNL